MRNVLVIFQSLIDSVLKGIQFKYVMVYIEDISIFSKYILTIFAVPAGSVSASQAGRAQVTSKKVQIRSAKSALSRACLNT